jgi:hypothetical protein
VAPTIPPPPQLDEATRCYIEYFAGRVCDCLLQGLVSLPLNARRPSHVDVPFSAVCLDRHAGTGLATDPVIALAGGGPFTTIVDFTVPDGHRAEIKFWGIDVTPQPARIDERVRLLVDGRSPPSPFDGFYGTQPAASAGYWEGPPFTVADPYRDGCVHLTAGQTVQLQVQNANAGFVNIAARMGGWVYPPTIQTSDNSIRSTLTDQR